LRQAGRRFEPHLRSLDAIHVMTALELRPIEAFMTYDKRQARVAGVLP
jgi:predicted nucleic acid-binding protein